jgi:hypothetical protein
LGPEKFIETTPEQDMAELAFVHARRWQEILDNPTQKVEPAVKAAIVPELDNLYPYKGETVFVSGYGLHAVPDPETGKIVAEQWSYKLGVEGRHNGFLIVGVQEEGGIKHRIMQQLLVRSIREQLCATVSQEQTISSLFDLDSLVLPSSDVDAVFGASESSVSQDFDERMDLAREYSKELLTLYESSNFRSMKHGKQVRTVGKLLLEANMTTKLRDLSVVVGAGLAYAPLLSKIMHIVPFDIHDKTIAGRCVGLESVESFSIKYKPMRQDQDFIDKDAGMCLVVDPNPVTREQLKLHSTGVLYIPTGNQLFEAINAA